jgi:alpha-beta hydrolase superfamily lysophospholipase
MLYPSNAERLAWERTPEPGWIDSPDGPLFAWYHAPRSPRRGSAVLLCDTIGSERMNLHLTYRHLALRLAYEGFPVLRFDYAGTGDSSGSPRNADRLLIWERSLDCAAEALRRHSGIERLTLFGARLGATLCVRHMSRDRAIEAVVLWGPYLDGRSFLRNERALDRLAAANPIGRRPSNAKAGDQEYFGYLMNAETVAALTALDLDSGKEPISCPAARVFAWDAYTPEEELAALLSSRGTHVELTRDARLVSEESLIRQAIPEFLLEQTTGWLRERVPPFDSDSDSADEKSNGRLPRHAIVEREPMIQDSIREEAVFFGPDHDLFGIRVRPASDSIDSSGALEPALIFVNGGNNHRAGINRNYTEWSRSAAAAGSEVLRFDIRGLGDSPALDPVDLNVLYRSETISDICAAIDFMSEAAPSRPIVLCGLCAGAFQALHAALRDSRVQGLILLDILRWTLDPPSRPRTGFMARRRRQLRRAIDMVFPTRARGLLARTRRQSEALDEMIWTLVSRGVDVQMVAARSGNHYPHLLEALAGRRRGELEASGRFRLESLSDTNHIFSPLWAQERLGNLLLETLSRRFSAPEFPPAEFDEASMRLGSRRHLVEEEDSRSKEGI